MTGIRDITPGWRTKLAGRLGEYLVMAVDRAEPGYPVLTVRMMGRPEAPEFGVSLGEVDFTTLRSPSGHRPWAGSGLGVYTTPPPTTGRAWARWTLWYRRTRCWYCRGRSFGGPAYAQLAGRYEATCPDGETA